jgi:prepilin-type N-terminal cleavage/methylation domain-containing protein
MPRPSTSSRHGFTLIELLTVIAIIGILAAILLPTVSTIRARAATTADMSNLQQIGRGIQLHANDNRGLLPNNRTLIPGTASTPGGVDRWSFQEAVDRYFSKGPAWNRTSIYNFLSRGNMWYSNYAQPFPGFTPPSGYLQTRPVAYGYNGHINNGRWAGRLSSVPSPSRTVIVGEMNGSNNLALDTTAPAVTSSEVQTGYRVSRDGKALYLFVDGRVAMLSGDQSEPALTASNQQNIWRWW